MTIGTAPYGRKKHVPVLGRQMAVIDEDFGNRFGSNDELGLRDLLAQLGDHSGFEQTLLYGEV